MQGGKRMVKKISALLLGAAFMVLMPLQAFAAEPLSSKDFVIEEPKLMIVDNPEDYEALELLTGWTPYPNYRSYTLSNGKVVTIGYYRSWYGGRPQFDLGKSRGYSATTGCQQIRETRVTGDIISGYAMYSGVEYSFSFSP